MKAVYIEEHGTADVMRYGDLPDPVAKADEVLVDVHAASVNAADWKSRLGGYGTVTDFPYVPGRDFSGVVGERGTTVADLEIGEPVFGVCDLGHEGAYAGKIAIRAAIVARKPDDISHVDAAAVALTGITALVCVEETLALQPGERILIQGGAGGVGSFALQLAKHIGACVITTASPANRDYLLRLGADEVIDYTTRDFVEVLSDCDAVLDAVGGDVALKCFDVLKPGGRAAFIASGAKAPKSPRGDVVALRPHVGRDRRHLQRIVSLLQTGAVRVPPVDLYPLSEAAAAHRVSESRHLRGKLVLRVR